ncbi:Topoisomerase II-associated PAT1 protein [Rutstroemia sp. NJR-2017a BVV2]|nr:Topoisomerase II-associated PAT1 protein [Rutstroemia sp. NJR-2017a BVV2]
MTRLQHPGVPQGHMAGMPHNPGHQGQPGQGMPQQMHMGVSAPGGPQVSQAGAMMAGMPPGAGGPNAHALQHLNPNQQALYQQQQQAMNFNPQLMQQHQMMQHQAAQQRRQAIMAQQYSGIPVAMPNGMNPMAAAQMNAQFAMRGATPMARPINLPQHLAAQQQQAQHSMEQQQAQQQAQQQHQQQMIAQHMALQQHQNAQNHAAHNQPGQPGQLTTQQIQNMQQAQAAAQQQQQQQQQQAQQQQAQQAQAAAASQQQNQNQPQGQSQPPQQASTPQSQAAQQPAMQAQQVPGGLTQQQQQQHTAAILQAQQLQAQQNASLQQAARQGDKIKGQSLMRLIQFGEHLSAFGKQTKPLAAYMANGVQRLVAEGMKQKDDLGYWGAFVEQFFSPKGVLRHSVFVNDEHSNKQYEITFPALPRYFYTHFDSGVKNMQMILEKGTEKALPAGHYIESQNASFVYWFDNGSQLVATGSLRAHLDGDQKIELLEFVTSEHEEYVPRSKVLEAARPLHNWNKEWKILNSGADGKPSPEMNKKKQKAMKSPPTAPPEIDIPDTLVNERMGITHAVFRFLEFVEVLGQMNPLFHYSHQNSSLSPYEALNQYVAQVANGANNGQQNPSGPRTPGMTNFPVGASPAAAHLQLPEGSPHMGGSPAQAPGMQLQQSQHGTTSSGPSANTSPNASNKRRRPSTVKAEDEGQVNGTGKPGVKPSPRMTKRQKGNQA